MCRQGLRLHLILSVGVNSTDSTRRLSTCLRRTQSSETPQQQPSGTIFCRGMALRLMMALQRGASTHMQGLCKAQPFQFEHQHPKLHEEGSTSGAQEGTIELAELPRAPGAVTGLRACGESPVCPQCALILTIGHSMRKTWRYQ